MSSARRVPRPVVWGTALLAGLAAAAWLLHVPYHPERADRAVPAEALFVAWLRAPGPRLQALAANPWAAEAIDAGFGAGAAAQLAAQGPDPLLRALTSDRAVLALVPMGFAGERPVWVGAAWAGARGRRLRWQLRFARPAWVERAGRHGGRPIYRVPARPGEPTLYFTFEDGVILACRSADPHDIRRLLDAHDGLRPSIRDEVPAQARPPGRAWNGPEKARVWAGRPAPGGVTVAGRIDALDAGATQAQFSVRPGWPAARTWTAPADEVLPAPRWGAWPDAGLWVRTAPIADLGLTPAAARVRQVWDETLGARIGDWAAFGLFGPPLTGRYRGVRVPALVGVTAWEGPEADAGALLTSALDALNASFRWGLIAAPVRAGPHTLWRIEGTADNAFGALADDEFPALAVADGGLWIASNTATLRSLLEDEAPPQPPPAVEGATRAVLRAELSRIEPTLRLALGAYRLGTLMAGHPPDDALDERLDEIEDALPRLAPLGRLEVEMRDGTDHLEIRARATH